jgi:hypothetical protein
MLDPGNVFLSMYFAPSYGILLLPSLAQATRSLRGSEAVGLQCRTRILLESQAL